MSLQSHSSRSFHQLLRWASCVRGLKVMDVNLVSPIRRQAIGVDSARGDDAASMKLAVASWLNESSPAPDAPIHSRDKTERGFYDDETAKLLRPVDFNWADMQAHYLKLQTDAENNSKEEIRDYESNFQVTAHSFHYSCIETASTTRRTRRKGFSNSLCLSEWVDLQAVPLTFSI
ncbi:hypothetical protein M405DRAFT_210470 [Rhizopogon salebrosus TDB-379]|nr:hypothetical protein M405DRAFT_210470 [Rhizopogon salebrosus TDB-379]